MSPPRSAARTLDPMGVELRWGAAFTAEDLEDMPDDGHRYELVDGCLIVTPAPNLGHQEFVGNLYVLLRGACPPGYKVILAPFEAAFPSGPSATMLDPRPQLRMAARTAGAAEEEGR